MLCQDGHNRHENSQKTVLEDSNPNNLHSQYTSRSKLQGDQSYIKPGQPTPGNPPDPIFRASSALLQPRDGPNPLFRLDSAKVVLLAMEIGGDIMAQQREEGGNRERFVAVAHHAIVDSMFVEEDAQPGNKRINRHHQQDPNDTMLVSTRTIRSH